MPEPKQDSGLNRFSSFYERVETRLTQMPRRNLFLIILGLIVFFLAMGALFGFVFSPYRQTDTPDSGLVDMDGNGNMVSHSGIVRRLDEEQDGISFYLEKEDETRVLLKSSQIDLAFFGGSAVTAEGVLVDGTGTGAVLFVSKIRIK
ncbi:MAG: hypothetical protein WEC39_01415 [Patescibacteria group bacterium]